METPHLGYSYFAPAVLGAVQPGLSRAAHVARVKAAMLRAAQDTLDREGFTQVVPSLLTSTCGACGDPGTLVPVDMGGRQAYLRQTSQLHLEPLMRELGRVYSISRSFRAERRIDDRHLAEFTLVEGEAAGWNLDRTMALMERLVVAMLQQACTSAGQHLTALGAPRPAQTKAQFARMTYDEAIIALQKRGHFAEWGEDLTSRHETALTDIVGGPLFVTHYPLGTRFFTMKVRRDDPRVVECCDLLVPGVGEVMGASETEHDPDILQSRLESSASVRQWLDLGGSTQDFDWYLDMHRQQSLQQAGFGLGFERLVRYACALKSVSEA
ncbi:MAG TPA: asparagine--tRNA ligase [Chloroflexia bacterium]|jgi:asparaginyl-tRNA synthetase